MAIRGTDSGDLLIERENSNHEIARIEHTFVTYLHKKVTLQCWDARLFLEH